MGTLEGSGGSGSLTAFHVVSSWRFYARCCEKSKWYRNNPSPGEYNHITGGDQTNINEKENSNARIRQWKFIGCECPGQRDEQGSHVDGGDCGRLHWKMGLELDLEGSIGFIDMVRKEKVQVTRTEAGLTAASTSIQTAPLLVVLATLSHFHFPERSLMPHSTWDPNVNTTESGRG